MRVRVEKYVLKDLLALFSSSFFLDGEEEEKEGEEDEVGRLTRYGCVCMCMCVCVACALSV